MTYGLEWNPSPGEPMNATETCRPPPLGMNLDQIFKDATQKDGGLNEFYLSQQLRNVKTFKNLPQMLKPLTLKELQDFILKLADEFIDKAKPPSK